MARSQKHAPVTGFCGHTSERFYKRQRASQERRVVRDRLRRGEFEGLHLQQVPWDEWATGRDGKIWWGDEMDDRAWRK